MGNQETIRPPQKAEGSPPSQRIGAGVEIGGQPQTTCPTAGDGYPSCHPSQHQSNCDPEWQAQNPDALVVAATRCQAFRASVRPQPDALGQNLPSGAISSAVEHLPYKEIVTGSIPVSPISRGRSAADWGLWKFQGSGRLACIAVAKHAVSTVGGFA